jgi:putative acetyltransferase
MIKLVRTDSSNADFVTLVADLDRDLAIRDGDEHSFYDQYNKIDKIKHFIVAYLGAEVVGCGAIKEYSSDTMEVKRMYVPLSKRGAGIASIILAGLEGWAREMNYTRCILETGYAQPEAIKLYEKNAYIVIPNYGQYEGMANSVCFEKDLK